MWMRCNLFSWQDMEMQEAVTGEIHSQKEGMVLRIYKCESFWQRYFGYCLEGFEGTKQRKVVGFISTVTAEEYFRSWVRVGGCFSDGFLVQVELYHSLVLSYQLFFKVLETLSK